MSLGSLGTVSQDYWWGAEVAYEQQSGDAMLVWNDGSDLRYTVWDGASWTPDPPGTIASCTSGEPRHMKLAANPTSDEMVLVVNHDNMTDCALVWNGSSWGNETSLNSSASHDRTDIFVAYEQQSGDALVIYQPSTPSAHTSYRVWDGASWSEQGGVTAPEGTTGYARWATLASDPRSDRLVIGVLSTDQDVWFSVWNGSAWETAVAATNNGSGNTFPNVAVAFEAVSGEALATYGESGSVRYRTWGSGVWSGELTAPSIGDPSNSMTLDADPISDGIMLSIQDDGQDLSYILWSGSSWGPVNGLEGTSGETKNQPFVFVWKGAASVLIDGDFSEWADGSGNEICAQDEAGADDWNNPSTADITKFCAASDLVNDIYLLFGFDDVTFSGGQNPTACVLVDTDTPVNGSADYLFCATLEGPGPTQVQVVELFSCDDTSAEGCPNATWIKNYTAADYGFSNTEIGPFGNADSFIELRVPWSDIGIAAGGQIVFFNLITYQARTLLTSPKDSIFGLATQEYSKRIDYDVGTGETTPVVISSFSAAPESGGVVVEWETSAEVNTAGFYLYRWDRQHREYVQVNEELLPAAVGSPQGGVYTVFDGGAPFGSTLRYAVVEVVAGGGETTYGPFDVRPDGRVKQTPEMPNGRSLVASNARSDSSTLADEPARASGTREVTRRKKSRKMRSANPLDRRGRNDSRTTGRATGRKGKARVLRAARLKIVTREPGIHYVSTSEIAAAWQVPPGQVKSLVRRGALDLRRDGEAVAWLPAPLGEGLSFYAESNDSPYGAESFYWLGRGRGLVMKWSGGDRVFSRGEASSFRETIHFEESRMPVTSLAGVSVDDIWFWSYISAGSSRYGSSLHEIEVPGVAPGGAEAVLRVTLRSMTETPASLDHHAVVSVNGTPVGDAVWDGAREQVEEVSFSQSLLRSGLNTIEIQGVRDEAPYSMFLVDSLDLSYERLTRAEKDCLLFRPEGGPVTVSGFSQGEIEVLDVTSPKRPEVVEGVTVRCDSECRATVSMLSSERSYFAASLAGVLQPVSVTAVEPVNLLRLGRADWIAVAPRDLLGETQRLADLRRSEGLSTAVIALEDVYDRFAGGEPTPAAIRSFLLHAWTSSNEALRYVVLVGAGTFDYRDYQGRGGNLVSPRLVETPYGIYASDTGLADVAGDDGVPEVAIGRIPVATPSELAAYIDKLELQRSPIDLGRVVLLADNPDAAGNFTANSDVVAGLLPTETSIDKIYLPGQGLAAAKQELAEALGQGASLLNYVGHGGVDRMAHEGLVLAAEAPGLGLLGDLPVVTAFTCNVGRFEIPGFRSLAEAMVLAPAGGATAIWSPTGQSLDREAAIINRSLARVLSEDRALTLGDAVLAALADYREQGADRFMLDVYNILGDPAVRIR
jgi:hypothetical protein